MGKRYYCEYCDRSFIDDIDSRKKHLNGFNHLRNKKLYYKYNRDLKTLVDEERAKDTCKRFLNTGLCNFGEHCTFSHYSRQELDSFEKQVEETERMKSSQAPPASVEGWFSQRGVTDPLQQKPGAEAFTSSFYFRNDLPPSLRLPTPEECNYEFEQWGV